MSATTHHHGAVASHCPRHANRAEYATYFALVLLISVPTAAVRSVLPRRSSEPRRFFLREAWAMAHRVTPQIFAV